MSGSNTLTLETTQYLHQLHPEASESLATYESMLSDLLGVTPKYSKTDRYILQQLLSNFSSDFILELGTDVGISTLAICEKKINTQQMAMVTDQSLIVGFMTKYLQEIGLINSIFIKHQKVTDYFREFMISSHSVTLIIHAQELEKLLADPGIILWFQTTKASLFLLGVLEIIQENKIEIAYPFLFFNFRETTFLPINNGTLISFYA